MTVSIVVLISHIHIKYKDKIPKSKKLLNFPLYTRLKIFHNLHIFIILTSKIDNKYRGIRRRKRRVK